jgi:hypothetical protein
VKTLANPITPIVSRISVWPVVASCPLPGVWVGRLEVNGRDLSKKLLDLDVALPCVKIAHGVRNSGGGSAPITSG